MKVTSSTSSINRLSLFFSSAKETEFREALLDPNSSFRRHLDKNDSAEYIELLRKCEAFEHSADMRLTDQIFQSLRLLKRKVGK